MNTEIRRNDKQEITKILLCDIWGLDINSPRLVIRSDSDFNRFCLVSLHSGEITFGPADEILLRNYLDGENKFREKFQFFGSTKPILYNHFKNFGMRETKVANLVVYKNE